MPVMIDKTGAEIDTDGLPDELINELSVGRSLLEKQIISVLPKDGSGISLDAILVRLYRDHGVLKKRRFMQNKLYRMPEVDSVADRKGVYSLHPGLVEKEPAHD